VNDPFGVICLEASINGRRKGRGFESSGQLWVICQEIHSGGIHEGEGDATKKFGIRIDAGGFGRVCL
jgi:hypothetical protein